MATIVRQVELTVLNCGECGGTYAINERYRRQKYEKRGHWHCPYCRCSWGYSAGNSKIDDLESELAQAKRQADYHQQRARENADDAAAARRRLHATKGVVTKQRKKLERVKAGVCPCCNRTFQNLQQHMANKHPEFQE